MGKSSGTQTVEKRSDPWGPAQPALRAGLQRLGPAYQQAAALPIPQDYGLTPMAAGELGRTIRGEYLGGNPYLDEVIARMTADVNSQFAGSGRYGSGAHQDALARAIGGLRYADYGAERARQMAALEAAPGFDVAPFDIYGQQVAARYGPLSEYFRLAGGAGGLGGMGAETSPLYRNRAAGALGGGLAGLGTAGGLAALGVAAPFPGAGWALGGLGALLGAL